MVDLAALTAGDIPAGCLKLIQFVKAHGYNTAVEWAKAHHYSVETINYVMTVCKIR